MGLLSKLAENMSTGANATMSMRGVMENYDIHSGTGSVSCGGKIYKIKVNPKNLKEVYNVFPYNIPEKGTMVLINLDSSKTYAIQVVAALKSERGLNMKEIINKA